MPSPQTATCHFFLVTFNLILSCFGWQPAATSSTAFTFCLWTFLHLARILQQILSPKGLLTQGKEIHLSHISGRLFSKISVFILEGHLSISICSSTQFCNTHSTKAAYHSVTLEQSHVLNLWWVINWLNGFPQTEPDQTCLNLEQTSKSKGRNCHS